MAVTQNNLPIDRPAAEAAQNNNTAPRKRRRRAPASGASEDCFACRKRGVKCDRRRPYCGPCIEMGKECSGYRTTLTWGVGVASRGKLRGMSLPIPKSQQVAKVSSEPKTTTTTTPAKQTVTPRRKTLNVPSLPIIKSQLDFCHDNSAASSPIPIPSPSGPFTPGWNVPHFGSDHFDSFPGFYSKQPRNYLQPRPLQRLQTSMSTSYDEAALSASAGSITYSDSDYPSPSEFPGTPDDYNFLDAGISPYTNVFFTEPTSLSSAAAFSPVEIPQSFPMADDLSSSISSEQSTSDYADTHLRAGSFSHANLSEQSYFDGDFSSTPSLSPGYSYYQQMESLLAESLANENVVPASVPTSLSAPMPRSLRFAPY